MNRKALIYAIIYCIIAVGYKLFMVLSGKFDTHFGFYYTHFLTVLLLIPFIILAITGQRKKYGYIAGRDAMRIGLTVVAVAAVVMTVYSVIEVQLFGRQMGETYYNGPKYLEELKRDKTLTPDKYPVIISQQVKAAGEGSFKNATAKLFPLLLFGISTSFIAASLLKRNKTT